MDVLFLEASYGEGHRRAAEAVEQALVSLRPDLAVTRHDFLTLVPPPISRATRQAYIVAVRHAPALWHLFYRGTERIGPHSLAQRVINRYGRRELLALLEKEAPRLVVNTFPTPAGIVSDLRGERRIDVGNAVVVTDHAVHSQWLHPGVDRYYVGAEEVKAGMVRRGIDPDRVVVSGIPVHPAFALPVDADDVRAELGVARDFVVLFMAGAYGLIGGFDAVLRAVAGEALEATLLVVAGRDEGLRRALTGAPVHPQNQLLVLGFRDDVHRLMAASDLLVSKAGGLTTSEAMARGLPMVVFRPIPGQEEHNVRLLLSRGAGVLARTVPELCRLLRELRRDRARRADMQRAARALGRPQAAATVAQDLVNVFC